MAAVITAVDTNVLLDVFGADPKFGPASSEALRRCLREGALIASEVVWAETATVFGDTERFEDAIRKLAVSFSPMTREVAIRAAQAWRRYRAGGGPRSRIAADFLIGAHALTAADRLLTRDQGFYRRYFAGLRIIDPSA
ncbi:MAG TPA: type II toxin-antitoxin system VapC family toxin [Candidatus Binataceae bacterium]|nr:type II toxin-antitoxin system VapC family toxin [Candidatus Binataceae bacterium]